MRLHRSLFRVAFLLLGTLVAAFAVSGTATAQVRCVAVHGSLLKLDKPGGWESVATGSVLKTNHRLVALFGADFQSQNGAVDARLVADVGQRGPFPVLEAAIRFNTFGKMLRDLDVTLERGILVLTNKKEAGPAKVRLRMHGEIFDVTLESKARLGVEIYGRHAPGELNVTDPKLDDPVANAVFFAVEGETVITTKEHVTRLHAPPGNAMYMWDSVTRSGDVTRFEKLPDFAKPMDEKERKNFEMICECAKLLAAKPSEVGQAFEKAVGSANAGERKIAVVALGALDELPRLLKVLEQKEHADARDMAILVLRHWLGREPGQSVKLYEHLTKEQGLTPIQAKNFLHLLNGLEVEKLQQPSTYDVLIHGLNHKRMAVRELARWHLVRLVPDGKSIAYDAGADEAQRLEAIAAWRRLVPEGQLPIPAKKKTTNP
jgi:hypothetical protein